MPTERALFLSIVALKAAISKRQKKLSKNSSKPYVMVTLQMRSLKTQRNLFAAASSRTMTAYMISWAGMRHRTHETQLSPLRR